MKSKAVWLVMVLLAGVGLIRSQTERSLAPGSTLPGISPMEAELFRIGLEDFLEVESAEEGLGPAFNGRSCAECHNQPAVGGASVMTETRAGFVDEHGRFRALNGDTLYQLFSVPPHRCQVQIPVEANVIARRAPIPLFGAGLVEAIPDETIVANEDPEDANGDGISGLAARITDVATGRERIGRFGWKAQHATLLAFSADAYRNEMGITNDLFREEMALAVDPEHMRLCDSRRDPEDRRDPRTGRRGIDNFENFMKLLAPIERGRATAEVSRGEELFSTVGCAACHTPRMTTGPSANPIFDRKPVHLYSDLLLHDVGTGDGIVQGPASAQEIRTPALWGLRLRRPLLHDGTAATADQAIRKHGAEAARVRERYLELPHDDRAALLAFLNSL